MNNSEKLSLNTTLKSKMSKPQIILDGKPRPRRASFNRGTFGDTVKTVNTGYDIYLRLVERYEKLVERFTYSIEIGYDYRFYPAVVEWINPRISTKTFATTVYNEQLKFFPNNKVKADFKIGPYSYSFVASKADKRNTGAMAADDYDTKNTIPSLRFTCRSKAAFERLKKELDSIYTANKDRIVPEMFTVGHYSGWQSSPKVLPRKMDSVFLAPGLKDTIMDDLETHFDIKNKMHRIGLPHHRGYILYGPPGCGKTSVSKALADHYDLNMYTLSLSGVKSDKDFIALIQEMKPQSVLLIEDIDVFDKVISREQNDGLTLAGLLNGLDGVMTPDGLITIVTTNVLTLTKLDEALIRSGRFDKKFYVDKPVPQQVRDIFEAFYDEKLDATPRKFESMSDVVDVLKDNPYDAESARLLVKEPNGKEEISTTATLEEDLP
jgi:hypothetical protein